MSKISKGISALGFILALVIEWAYIVDTYLPTAREFVETLGGYLLFIGSVIWFGGLSLLLTEHRAKYRLCAVLTAISMPLLIAAYALMTRWR